MSVHFITAASYQIRRGSMGGIPDLCFVSGCDDRPFQRPILQNLPNIRNGRWQQNLPSTQTWLNR